MVLVRRGLGRLPAPDARDLNYPMRAMLPATTQRTKRHWYDNRWWGDQGMTSQCVAYAWDHWLSDGPTVQRVKPPIPPQELYDNAQSLDEWPGNNYEGTSVRGGVKAVQGKGFVTAYHWAQTVDDIVLCLLERGPVVVGFNWYESMFEPTAGIIQVGGSVVGGHAFVLNGVNTRTGLIRMKNSWGREWGVNGRARITIPDVSRLLNEGGEACIATEVRV